MAIVSAVRTKSMALRRLLVARGTRGSLGRQFHASGAITADALDRCDTFSRRHLGPSEADAKSMLKSIGFDDFESMVKSTVPPNILAQKELDLQPALTETEALETIKAMADKNKS